MTAPAGRPAASQAVRAFAEQALSRAAGADLVEGNSLGIHRDARETFPAWLGAIESARDRIHLECYFITDDHVGRMFADALIRKARAGVQIRLIHDWVGCLGESGRGFYRPLRDAGIEVRCFNPPRLDDPFGLLSRDHRKMLAVDGQVGFVTGLCLSGKWEGNPARQIAPWRDTGVVVQGPAVAELEAAFGEVWAACGDPLPPDAQPPSAAPAMAGDVALRVIPTVPSMSGLYRLDLLVSALARKTLWLTDAYFVGVPTYVQALCNAARDGVDVRLLVPGSTDVPVVSPLSRSGYRPLLEAGVRVFEWNGTMLHAKTSVVDGRWARVGSSNLNMASWLGNYELDVAIEHEGVARELESHYGEDLTNATEIVLSRHSRIQRVAPPSSRRWLRGGGVRAGSGRAAASALLMANSLGSAMTHRRILGAAESRLMANVATCLLVVAALGLAFPWILAVPLSLLAAWIGMAAMIKALRLRNQKPASESPGPSAGATMQAVERLP